MFWIKASVTRYNVQKIHLSESKWNVDNVLQATIFVAWKLVKMECRQRATSNHFCSIKIVPDCRNQRIFMDKELTVAAFVFT